MPPIPWSLMAPVLVIEMPVVLAPYDTAPMPSGWMPAVAVPMLAP